MQVDSRSSFSARQGGYADDLMDQRRSEPTPAKSANETACKRSQATAIKVSFGFTTSPLNCRRATSAAQPLGRTESCESSFDVVSRRIGEKILRDPLFGFLGNPHPHNFYSLNAVDIHQRRADRADRGDGPVLTPSAHPRKSHSNDPLWRDVLKNQSARVGLDQLTELGDASLDRAPRYRTHDAIVADFAVSPNSLFLASISMSISLAKFSPRIMRLSAIVI
jgi:hypothetical protein